MDAGGAVLTVRSGTAVGLIALVVLLATLAVTSGLTGLGLLVGLACAVVMHAAIARGLARCGAGVLGPADLVTLTRATLACGVAALVAESFRQPAAVTTLASLSAGALVLDAVDGRVARRTRTATTFGARFDGEIDAFLILVLSVYVARTAAAWVLAIGAARYVFGAAGWLLPWLRKPLPPRYWRKVVAGVQGVVLTVVAADVVPPPLAYAALAVSLVLLAESFGTDVWWLWRRRHGQVPRHRGAAAGEPRSGQVPRRRLARAVATDVLALLLVWVALVMPNQTYLLRPSTFARIPVEALAIAGLALVLPDRARRTMAAVVGALLGLLTLIKVLDMGFFAAFDRPFDPVSDAGYFAAAVDLVTTTAGTVGATIAVAAVVTLLVVALVCLPLSVGRLTGLVARHRRWSLRVVSGLGILWLALALTGLQLGQEQPIATASTGRAVVGEVRAVADGVRDQQRFEAAAAVDRFRDAGDRDLLAGLRGKDVLLVFVESYGRSALDGLPSSGRVRAVLDAGTRRLHASGYSTRSAFLTSPTFGGLSWLAHATLQSGLWVDDQRRYDRLLSGTRMTLSGAFSQEGWRTVAVMPSNEAGWPEGEAFYRLDQVYDRADFDYRGPRFGWSPMPDQYLLSSFRRLALAADDRAPVMAEVDLTSSHPPWSPLPRMVDWSRMGDGSLFHRIHRRSPSAQELWRHPEDVDDAYARSIVYSLSSLVSYVERYGDDDLVLIVLGDHQPATVVTGHGASHDVPVTIVARDPAVLDRMAGWGWQECMTPDSAAPVWPMDAFRNRFLDAYSPRLPRAASSASLSSASSSSGASPRP